ncbi:MAG: protein translocase subunit SecF [Xanthomonadales bacterium]|jgi:preprotein translocase subunit SecF|uniref:protein translocase subunit SecF n=1 Tax=Thermomonas TaxID=141948 RepID=UPI001AC3E68F|nr:protein translocase subunit SecF [Thermomonas mangrovi]MBN8263744.1 protein translocase subunit SecF [Xanthomonadales bacterium]HMT37809.1 protein translocase subunit SecF [Thermomonas sp.]
MKPFNVFPYDSNIDFMRLRLVSLGVAFLLMVVALGAIGFKGFNFALDFTGGVGVELRYAKSPDVDAVRTRLEANGYPGAQVQAFGSGNDLLVRLQTEGKQAGGADKAASIGDAVAAAASLDGNPAEKRSSAVISAQVGRELAEKGVYALLFVVIGFLAYISARFEWKFAVAAIITTLHDVLICAGWFALTGHEFDLTVLAGILSVMGYSINDTIVVFDRVRENFKGLRAPPGEVLNKSINQTLSRTVITSFVAMLTVLALYLYGGGSLRGMAESQMLGIAVGTLSSIFVACPLLMWLGVSKQDLMPKAKDVEALARRP